jgi:hypothetical protein
MTGLRRLEGSSVYPDKPVIVFEDDDADRLVGSEE